VRYPLFQVQPLLRQCYSDPSFDVLELNDLNAADWDRFEATMRPNTDSMRPLGHYAVDTRKRLRGGSRRAGADGDSRQHEGCTENRAGADVLPEHDPAEQGCPHRLKIGG
jgi:hypothetical protein